MSLWNDFNDAQSNSNGSTGSVYLDAEYTVLEGPYAKRKIWSLIGLYSPNGPNWANMGRSLVRGILNSSRGISDKDNSPEAQARRRINGFADLDGLEFIARIDVGQDTNGDDKNEIKSAVMPDHRDYPQVMGHVAAPGMAPQMQPPVSGPQYQAPVAPSAPAQGYPAPQSQQTPAQQAPAAPGFSGRPSWAE
jgi:hypothetical protein